MAESTKNTAGATTSNKGGSKPQAATAAQTPPATQVNEPLKKKEVIKVTEHTFTEQEAAQRELDRINEGGRNWYMYSCEPGDGKKYFVIEANPTMAIGRLYQKLGTKMEAVGSRTTRRAPATADDFISGFTTLSDTDREKVLAALRAGK
jgi:hypothetical protein